MNFKYTHYRGMLKSAVSFLLIQVLLSSVWQQAGLAQTLSACTTEGLLMGWNFDVIKTDCPGGAVARQFKNNKNSTTAALFYQDKGKYCPNINTGCGTGLLGSKGHNNTPEFANGICLINFYNPEAKFFGYYGSAASYDPNSTVFDPLGTANLYVTYTVPAGKASCFTGFALKILQATQATAYGSASASPSFEKQGVAVYRNGVQIYNSTQPIAASNINGTPMRFNFSGTEFCTDGSQAVTFTVYFGLVHRLAVVTTGYDDLMLYGTCGGPVVTATAAPATCATSGGINSDGKITLTGFSATNKYDYTPGNTYTGSATYATATAIPANGVIVSNLPDPAVAKTYTIRVFDASGCYKDVTVTLTPAICTPACTPPGSVALVATLATCNGTTPANNASVTVSGVVGGDKVGISAGATYTGPDYTSATALTSGGYTFASLPNPVGNQVYTVRVFNGSNTCYSDKTVVLNENTCTPCKNAVAFIKTSDTADPDSKPNNGITSEDDQVTYQACTNPQNIDLKLTKTVTPNTGATCPVGTTFTWTLTLTNAGTMSATNIQVADYLPLDQLQLISATPSAGTFALSGGWQLASLGAGQSATLKLVTKALGAGTIQNCAEVANAFPLNDPNSTPGNGVTTEDDYACASITVTGPTIPALSKEFSPMQTRPNVPTRLTLKIWNNETTPITLTQNLVDNLPNSPAQMTIAPTPNLSVTNSIPVIAAAGATMFFIPSGTVLPPGLTQISMDVIAPANGDYCNVIAAGALQTSSCSNVFADTACVSVSNAFVLSPIIKKAFAASKIQANQTTLLTITVENRNSFPLTLSEDFSDFLPTGLVTAGTASSTCGAVTVVGDSIITLAKGSTLPAGSCTISVLVKSATAGTYCNQILMNAMLTEGGGKIGLGNQDRAEACVEVVTTPIFDLALTKKLAPTQKSLVLVGDTVTHNIEVINQGTVAATNVQVTDYLPSSMSLVADATWTLSGSNAVLATPIATLAPGASQIIPIKLKIVSGTVGDTLVNRAEISAASGGTDKDSSPDSNSGNDAGGRYNSPSDDSVNGNGTGQPNDRSGLTDEDDADPDYVVLTQCVNSNLAAGVILSPKAIRSQNDVVQITFGLTNPGSVPLSGITFVGQVKSFNRPNSTPVTLTLTKQGDTNNDGIMQPNESWLYTGTFSSSYTPGTVFVVTGEATASCGSATIKAATADLLYTVGVNMDVVKGGCVTPGGTLNVDLVTRLLVDEDMARNPGSITVGSINIPLPKRRFEARGLKITVQGVNNNQPFDPFNPPSGVSVVRLTDQGNVDGGRNTNNILDESDPVNTYRAPCTALGQDDVGCEFPDWVFRVQVSIPSNYSSSTFVVSASDDFKLYQSVEDPAGSGTFKPFEDITPTGGSGGSDSETFTVCSSAGTTDLRLKSQVSQSQTTEGTEVEYVIKVWNESSTPATGVEVADSLVGGLRYVSSSATRGSYNPTTYRWVIGTVGANGDTVTLRIRVRVVSQGVFFNTVELVKYNEQDVDSTPGNGTEGEDDLDHQCVTVPISLCTGEEVEVSLPSNFSGVKWYKNGVEISSLTGKNVVLLSESGTYSYTATNNSCPVEGCCPIVIRGGSNCCPVDLCIPLTVKKKKKR